MWRNQYSHYMAGKLENVKVENNAGTLGNDWAIPQNLKGLTCDLPA